MKNEKDPTELLKEDHDKVKHLFQRFEQTENEHEKKRIAGEAINSLKAHAILEQEIFYPAVKEESNESELITEALEEHHVITGLAQELETQILDAEHFEAKFKVLAEVVKHHIDEEESEIFPLIRGEAAQDLDNLTEAMKERKKQLIQEPKETGQKTAKRGRPTKKQMRKAA